MKIATISGSTRKGSATVEFLKLIAKSFPQDTFELLDISSLPLFHPGAYNEGISQNVTLFKKALKKSDALIIATPEYIHNIPAVLKSALEWTTQTGELVNKKTLAITYTPHLPRGEKAMISLLNSLKALDANIAASLDLYHESATDGSLTDEVRLILSEALRLLA